MKQPRQHVWGVVLLLSLVREAACFLNAPVPQQKLVRGLPSRNMQHHQKNGAQRKVAKVVVAAGGSEGGPSNEELHETIARLEQQVAHLSALYEGLAQEGGKSSSVPPPPAPKAASKASAETLVPVDNALSRIDSWIGETGGSLPPAPAPAAPAAVPAPPPPPPVAAAAPAPAVAAPAGGDGFAVTIDFEGATHSLKCDAETTVLEAALDAGIELPHSCMSGSCYTCPARLLKGTVEQSEGVLEEEQIERGLMLTCVSYPESDLHLEIIDEDELDE